MVLRASSQLEQREHGLGLMGAVFIFKHHPYGQGVKICPVYSESKMKTIEGQRQLIQPVIVILRYIWGSSTMLSLRQTQWVKSTDFLSITAIGHSASYLTFFVSYLFYL